MKTNFKNINWELLSKILTKEASDEEKKEFEKWLASDARNKRLYKSLKKFGQNRDFIKAVHKLDVEQALKNVKKIKNNIRFLTLKKLAKVAAILILVLGISFVLRYTFGISKMIVIETKNDQRTEVVLADGSEVSINENSRFSYPKKFNGRNRKVKLTGEAYFTVLPDKTKPFIVDMNVAYVKVLGTKFNINNQKKAEEITVMVTEGSVQFGASKSKAEAIVLKKGNSGKYDREQQSLSFEDNYDLNETAWKTGYLVFDNEALETVAHKIGEVYLIDLKVEKNLKSRKISAIYDNQPIEIIIQILESTLNVDINETSKNKYEIVSKIKPE